MQIHAMSRGVALVSSLLPLVSYVRAAYWVCGLSPVPGPEATRGLWGCPCHGPPTCRQMWE